MTEEELKKEAEEKAGIYFDSLDYDHGDVSDTPFSAYDVFVAYKKGALDFAEPREKRIEVLEKENAELRKVAEFQQSSNMETHLENKKLKEGLAVGSMWNKHLNSQNKALEEERDKYRNMTFDQREQLTDAKEIIKDLLGSENTSCEEEMFFEIRQKAEQFISEV